MSFAKQTLAYLVVITALALGAEASAQQDLLDDVQGTSEAPAGWDYHESSAGPTPQQIVQQKAQVRAAQRMARMAALQWHGYSIARPRTTATPYSGMYGGQWQGYTYGRPAAWHASRPVIVVTK